MDNPVSAMLFFPQLAGVLKDRRSLIYSEMDQTRQMSELFIHTMQGPTLQLVQEGAQNATGVFQPASEPRKAVNLQPTLTRSMVLFIVEHALRDCCSLTPNAASLTIQCQHTSRRKDCFSDFLLGIKHAQRKSPLCLSSHR